MGMAWIVCTVHIRIWILARVVEKKIVYYTVLYISQNWVRLSRRRWIYYTCVRTRFPFFFFKVFCLLLFNEPDNLFCPIQNCLCNIHLPFNIHTYQYYQDLGVVNFNRRSWTIFKVYFWPLDHFICFSNHFIVRRKSRQKIVTYKVEFLQDQSISLLAITLKIRYIV